MCGIVCAFNLKQPMESLRPKVLQMSKKIRHRGPDWSGIYSNNNAIYFTKKGNFFKMNEISFKIEFEYLFD